MNKKIIGIILFGALMLSLGGINVNAVTKKTVSASTTSTIKNLQTQVSNLKKQLAASKAESIRLNAKIKELEGNADKLLKIIQDREKVKQGQLLMEAVGQPYYSENVEQILDADNYPKIYTGGNEYPNDSYYIKTKNWAKQTTISFNLEGKYKTITGLFGVDDGTPSDISIKFVGDGKLISNFNNAKGGLAKEFSINVLAVKRLDLVIDLNNRDMDTTLINLIDVRVK